MKLSRPTLKTRLKPRLKPRPPTPQQSALFVFILVAISLGTWINGLFPSPQEVVDRPFIAQADGPDVADGSDGSDGSVGSVGHIDRIGTVEVAGLEAYEVYEGTGTQGIFLVVQLRSISVPEPLSYGGQLIDGQGRTAATQRSSTCSIQQTGLPAPCELAFEVDPGALSGSRLQVTRGIVSGDDAWVEFDLGIDDARAADLLENPRRTDFLGEEM